MAGYIFLFLAIVVLILGAYKGLGSIPLSLLASSVIILTGRRDIWNGYLEYGNAFGSSVSSFFFIFLSASFFAKCMDTTGAAMKIGHDFVKWFGSKRAILVVSLLVAVLTYGGVNLWIVIYVTLPIAFTLFREANLPRHLIAGAVYFGSCTFTMTSLPGCLGFPNIFAAQALGTTMMAAPFFGILASIGLFVFGYTYLCIAEKRARKCGEYFEFPEGYDAEKYNVGDEQLPPTGSAFFPLICSIGTIFMGSNLDISVFKDSTFTTTAAMIFASVVCLVLNYRYINKKSDETFLSMLKNMMTVSSAEGIGSVCNLASIVAFGSVVSSTAAFGNIVQWLINLDISIYWKGAVSTAVISAVSGSASAGIRLCMQYLSEYFVSSGCDLSVLHRLVAIASGSVDSVPYAPGYFVTFQLLGVSHKNAYRHIFWTTLVGPSIVTIISAFIVSVVYL